jgi:hypothetical protein
LFISLSPGSFPFFRPVGWSTLLPNERFNPTSYVLYLSLPLPFLNWPEVTSMLCFSLFPGRRLPLIQFRLFAFVFSLSICIGLIEINTQLWSTKLHYTNTRIGVNYDMPMYCDPSSWFMAVGATLDGL